jgi:hypothetical protein
MVAPANSRFLHSAVPFAFAQGPTPVGMTMTKIGTRVEQDGVA